MKILVISQHYTPDPFRVSSICEALSEHGHQVLVLAGTPSIVKAGDFTAGKETTENGVRVCRVKTYLRRGNLVSRAVNYLSYPFFACRKARKLKESFDVVFIYQLSPVMMALPANAYAKRHGVKVVHYALDMWPESLAAGGIRPDSLIYKMFYHLSKNIYSNASEILISSESFESYIRETLKIKDVPVIYLPQSGGKGFNDFRIPPKKSIPGEADIMFAGNIGRAQDLKTAVNAAARTKGYKGIRWHIIGSGVMLGECRELAQKLEADNITFYGRRSEEEMPELYAKADAMLVTLSDMPVISDTLPGKVQSYLAAGKPIIAAVSGECERVICEARCGFVSRPGDDAALSEAVLEFASLSEQDRAGLAENAREYYDRHFSEDMIMGILIERLSANAV